MNIGGIGNTGIDYARYTNRQTEQEQAQVESSVLQTERTVTVQQNTPAYSADNNETQTTQSALAALSSEVAESLESEDDSANQALINKANAGSTLTRSELSRLKEIDPGLYSQAVKAEKAREELRQQMKENPSGASRSACNAVAQYSGEDQAITRSALADEYKSFAAKYDQASFGMSL